jgi:serine phosphatase RsbU (regulator of sigma subunit)
MDDDGNLFGQGRLLQLLTACQDASNPIRSVLEEALSYSDARLRRDDMTLVEIKAGERAADWTQLEGGTR